MQFCATSGIHSKILLPVGVRSFRVGREDGEWGWGMGSGKERGKMQG